VKRADRAYCSRALTRGSKSFAAAALLLPPGIRRAILPIYAFCREADDLVDRGTASVAHVDDLRQRLYRIYGSGKPRGPVERALARVVADHDLPRGPFDAMLEAFAWEASDRRYQTLAEVEAYAARVAGSVGVMVALVAGRRDRTTLAYASALGIAMQLTNIARDVGEDARQGRLYLPLDWLRQAGLDPDMWLANPVPHSAVAAVTARVLARASELYRLAEPGIARLPSGVRPAIWAARFIYGDIGRIVRSLGTEAVHRRAVTSGARKAWLVGRACMASLWGRADPAGTAPRTAGGFLSEMIDDRTRAPADFDDAALEEALHRAVARLAGPGCPPALGRAIAAAVFPGGQRLRPRLCREVAHAAGSPDPILLRSASLSLELLHCASLVQDDLPVFDGAMERRGRPAIHRRFGAPVAILASDALIVEAFAVLEEAVRHDPVRGARLLRILARAVAPPDGLIAGQAWECERTIDLTAYHRGKTAALFEAAAATGAIASAADGEAWRPLGRHLGMAYQAADDIVDAAEDASRHGPEANAVSVWGIRRSRAAFHRHVDRAFAAVPRASDGRLQAFLAGLFEGFAVGPREREASRPAMVGSG